MKQWKGTENQNKKQRCTFRSRYKKYAAVLRKGLIKLENNLDKALQNLKNAILTKPPKVQGILTDWINKWSKYIIREQNFDSQYLPYYKRGDVVYVDFGFNIGAEYGGIHYAVVVEINNNKKNGNIIVVPLTSLDKNKKIEDIPVTDVYLGDGVISWTNAATVAKPNQIRAVSKMRIVKPVRKQDKKVSLNGEQMTLIDNKLKNMIFYQTLDK